MMNDKNNEDLRVDNVKEGSEDVVVSIFQKKSSKPEKPDKPISVFSLFVEGFREIIKGKDVGAKEEELLPTERPKILISLRVLTAMILVAIVILCGYFFADMTALLPCLIICSSLIIPVLAICFFSEINTRKNVKIFWMFVSVAIGSLLYVVLTVLKEKVVTDVNFTIITRDTYFIVANLIKFVVAVMLVKFFRLTNKFSAFMVIVAFYMGYAFSESLHVLFEGVFIAVPIKNNGQSFVVNVLINNTSYLETAFKNVLSLIPYTSLYFPCLDLFLAIIIAYVLSVAEKAIRDGKEYPRSVYLLAMLGLMLRALSSTVSIIMVIKVLLNVISAVGLVILCITCINASFNEENYIKKKSPKKSSEI